jgi:glycosyltransferase involved in cell wall biosynthesis
MKLPISVFIICKDEEERIEYALKSVEAWVDEIVVIDSGSVDKTLEIAKKYTSEIYFNQWQGFGAQKIYGETKCKNNWILNIDADEEITEEVKNNIFKLFENGKTPSESAFKMHWKMLFLTQKFAPKYGVTSSFIRLYNKQKAGFRDSTIHDSVVVKDSGNIGEILGYVNHRCFKSLRHWADKINYYSSLQAEEWVAKGRRKPSIRIVLEPVFAFFKSYFIRKYFLYGIDGFMASIMYAYSKTLRLAKVRELYKLKDLGS